MGVTPLSKSRIMKGLQCPKALWLAVHRKDLAAPVGPEQQVLFDQGTEVGELARERFPGGVLIEAPPWKADEAATATRAAIEGGATALFEGCFVHAGVQVRVDVLHRASPDTPWHLVEVKSSTRVKDQHIPDVAVQASVLEGCGERLAGCHLMHVDRECEHPHLERLFESEDVTARVREMMPDVPDLVARLTDVVGSADVPDVDIGPHCTDPYECDFRDHCRSERGVPEWSVFDVRSLGRRAWDLYREGVVDAVDVHARLAEEGYDASTSQGLSAEALATGRRFTDREALRDALASWSHPRVFLDFETVGGAVPRYPGSRPFDKVPFQFSAQVQREPGGALVSHAYLHTDPSDPRPGVASALAALSRDVFGARGKGSGCVVAYNRAFERGCLDRLADACPEHAEALSVLARRLEDPLPLLRTSVYDRAFRASYSLKAVAPALLGSADGYADLAVDNGTMAGIAYAEMIAPDCEPARREELRAALLEYCGHDTAVLARLVEWMECEAGLLQ